MIRPAERDDAEKVIKMLQNSHEAAGFNSLASANGFHVPFERTFAERMFDYHLNLPGRLAALYVDNEGPKGFLLATAFQHPFGNVVIAKETAFWIEPEARGSMAAVRLLQAYENWAMDFGCKFIGMAGMGSDPKVGILYERLGYSTAEVQYLKAVT